MQCGEKIKEHRTRLGLTQKELAQRAKVATVSIQQYEAGVRNPKIETLCKIASGLEIPVEAIRSDSDLELESIMTGIENWGNMMIDEVSKENELINHYRALNTTGKSKAREQVELLTKIPEYRKDSE